MGLILSNERKDPRNPFLCKYFTLWSLVLKRYKLIVEILVYWTYIVEIGFIY